MARVDAILCDLFGTVVLFDTSVLPRIEIAGRSIPSTAPLLIPMIRSHLPHVDAAGLQLSLLATWQQARLGDDHREVSSSVRFGWALEELGLSLEVCAQLSGTLADVHAGAVCGATYLPNSHAQALSDLAEECRLALVSNFDHGPACRQMLSNHGLEDAFEAVHISDELGIRKPHPSIFEQSLSGLGLRPDQCLFVGDSFKDDVAGASACGMQTAWINPKGKPVPDGGPEPDLILTSFAELPAALHV